MATLDQRQELLMQLLAVREEKELSLSNLKESIGMDRSAISKLENGNAPILPSIPLVRYAETVGKRVEVSLTRGIDETDDIILSVWHSTYDQGGLDMAEKRPSIPPETIDEFWPGGFTLRDEANAIVAYAFRNGPLEDLHAGRHSPLLEDPTLSRLTDAEMKELMIDASRKMHSLLRLREDDVDAYNAVIKETSMFFCREWERDEHA